MEKILIVIAMIAGLIGALYLWNTLFVAPMRRRKAEAAPRITLDEAQAFWNAIEAAALPMARATVQERAPKSPKESRIAGAPLAIDDAPWPLCPRTGTPMDFIAQVNFADVPPIEDFPTSGILQLFSALDDEDETGNWIREIRWHPDPQGSDLMEPPDGLLPNSTGHAFQLSESARRDGLPLEFTAGIAPGNPYGWPFDDNNLAHVNRLPESDEVAAMLEHWEDRCDKIVEGYGIHWVGGQPDFEQEDVRGYDPRLEALTRVVLHIGFDDYVSLGDAGQLNLMISRDALLARDFGKAYLTWDCG